jgi:hypothetical protein
MVVSLALSAVGWADVVLPAGLPVGSQYRLVFLTDGSHDALSDDIAVYNAFVSQEAAASSSDVVRSATWKAIASTADVAAIDNASLGSALPVYDTHGELVVPGGQASPLLTITHLMPITWDQSGNAKPDYDQFPWTGTTEGGTSVFPGYGSFGLGGMYGMSIVGAAAILDLGDSPHYQSGWLSNEMAPLDATLPFYAISGPITVTPEPATMGLLVVGLIVGMAPKARRSSAGR